MGRAAAPGLGSVSGETKLVIGLVSGAEFANHACLVLCPPGQGILAAGYRVGRTRHGVTMDARRLSGTVLQLPFGYLSDNYSRVLTLAAGLVLCGLGTFAIALAPVIAWVFVGQGLIGLGLAAHHPAHFPLLADAVDESQRGRVFSVHGFAGQLGAVPLVYAVVSVAVLYSKVADGVLAPDDAGAAPDGESAPLVERARLEVRSILGSPAILALAVLAFVVGLAQWGVRSYAVVLLTDGYGLSVNLANTVYTALFVASAAATILGGVLADRLTAQRILLVGFAVLVVSAALVGTLLVPAIVAAVVLVLTAASIAFSTPARSKLTDTLSDSANIGMNFALITVGVASAGAIAPPVFGSIITYFDLSIAFYGVSLLAAVAAGLTVVIIHHYRDALAG
jgi:MFS family permease